MRLMAVHAHPDDESSRGAATLAKYAAEGHEVLVVTATGGERGDILNPAMEQPGIRENLALVRREEMAKAASILGVHHRWLGYKDSGLYLNPAQVPDDGFARVPMAGAVGRLVDVIRDFRPDVLLTYNECGGYPHPDHIRCHDISVAAYERCQEVSKLYYIHEPVRVTPRMVRNFERVTRLQRRFSRNRAGKSDVTASAVQRSLAVPRWVKSLSVLTRAARGISAHRVTTEISCSDYFELRDAALRAHATQLDPRGHFLLLPWTWRQRLWPTERYELAHTRVASAAPETDLFAGL